jgi:hypothetical protein
MDKPMNDFFITKKVQDSVEISIWKSFRASVWDSLFNFTSYTLRFNTLRDFKTRGSAWSASANATRDYFNQK